MPPRSATLALAFSLLLPALLDAQRTVAVQSPATAAAEVDRVFAQYASATSPGCAVGVAQDGRTILSKAYGMADLEHDVAATPATVYEAGSVSKQFTAAAVVLLAQQGKLSLSDDIRKYIPEVPDYGTPITIRHLLTHTSGLRDWGSVASIAGWPRTTRVHTHAHVLDIVSRQRALNYPPGTAYSYTNSGYNLLVILVDRVSGMPFAEFEKRNLFDPLGMTNTQWRDDFTRIVKNRAIAYSGGRGGGFSSDMPFENVHGNGGLLTTVGDLLIWTENLQTGKLGGRAFVDEMHRQGVLTNGQTITYASGLMVGVYDSLPEVSHTGSTAGYRAFLARYPQQRLAIAVLCNIASANPGTVGHGVANAFLGDVRRPAPGRAGGAGGGGAGRGRGAGQPAAPAPTAAELAAYAGEYYSPDAEVSLVAAVEEGRLVLHRRPATRMVLTPTGPETFSASLGTIRFIRDSSGRVTELSVRQDRVWDLRFSKR
jgi:CubicO group peptidase (beta-lactamase class C family)